VDGADEVSERLDLVKGGGGCHTREKIVNAAARTNVIVVDDSKLSRRLGERWPVPVEVLAFGHCATAAALEALGRTTLRLRNGRPWMTDSGNFLYDLQAGVLEEPAQLEARLARLPGVVSTGLFVGRTSVVLVAGANGLTRLTPGGR
jgi:ribose 5-phosphate isomerase A